MINQRFIYCLIRNSDNYVFYVGITNNLDNRLKQHRQGWQTSNDNNLMHRFIRECNNDIDILPIQLVNNDPLNNLEWYYISYFKHLGFKLINERNMFTVPFNQLNHNRFNADLSGVQIAERIFLENKSKYIW